MPVREVFLSFSKRLRERMRENLSVCVTWQEELLRQYLIAEWTKELKIFWPRKKKNILKVNWILKQNLFSF